ncbi:hypothetical protein A0H81_05455 [Grifola frondosa]|uniref:ubiquitinyl hydrolase 1 n=1 Tax=Grifola frondosa TaxID=5627 RepID=A0A1C7MD53_GRIFR|nr:hypothetical protein A0H81_05455 [Grifola frondosa]
MLAPISSTSASPALSPLAKSSMNKQDLLYIINHIFMPPKLPQDSDHAVDKDRALACIVSQTAQEYSYLLSRQLDPLVKMLLDLEDCTESLSIELVQKQLANMQDDGEIRIYGNAAVIVRNSSHETTFESFEVSKTAAAVMEAKGKLSCSYPGPAITIPRDVIRDASFRQSLANFLVHMNEVVLDAAPTTKKAKSVVVEERDTPDPRYITQLLTGIMRGIGKEATISRIHKRIADDTYLRRQSGHDDDYKSFMVFLMAKILLQALNRDMSSDLLFCMRAKLSRRLYKLGTAAPDFLARLVSEVTEKVEVRLTKRWTTVQEAHERGSYWNPDELNVSYDTRLSLDNCCDHLLRVLTRPLPPTSSSSFQPQHPSRFTKFHQFISGDRSNVSSTCKSDPHSALVDFEACVEGSLSDWVTTVTDVDSACTAIVDCMENYWDQRGMYEGNPENMSIMYLTLLGLWVALDQLALRGCPLLREYSPEIPESLFEHLLLRTTSQIDRLERAIQYLRGRHRQARWSVFTDKVDHNTFAVRFFATSEIHHRLKLRIEKRAELDKKNKLRELEEQTRENDLKSQVVVFELDCPTIYSAWRIATYTFLHDFCTPSEYVAQKPASPSTILDGYTALQQYWRRPRNARVTLASEPKPFMKSHYKNTNIPSNESQVCVNNALQFKIFDRSKSCWAADVFARCSIAPNCTFILPPGPYQCLQYAISGTSHTSNDIISNQAECHMDLTIHEFMAELRAKALTFRQEEVHALLIQAVWQVGPLSASGDPEWHSELTKPDFGSVLLGELEALLLGVEANWQEVLTVRTVIALAIRLLSSTVHGDVIGKACDLLRKARLITFAWLQQLLKKLQESDDDGVEEFRGRVCEMAAACRGTFDVDSRRLREVLCSAEDITILVQCAIVLHDNAPPDVTTLSPHLRILLDRDRRISHYLEPWLLKLIRSDRVGFDGALRAIWPAYLPGTSWQQMLDPNGRWLTSRTAMGVSQHSQDIHYNVLEGTLLINGRPLGRLPQNIVTHPLYALKVLHVSPGGIPLMLQHYPLVHFGFRRKSELVIRATQGDTVLELVPREKLIGDLPHAFVHDHIHWLDIRTGVIELRPTIDKWNSSSENWHIYFSLNSFMRRGDATLVDIRSPTYEMLIKRLEPLESQDHIIITCCGQQSEVTLSVDLPRYSLSFFVDEDNELQSRNMRNMVVDSNQSTGTMIGLRNQLVLRPADSIRMKLALARCVLVPVGEISLSQADHHIVVQIDTGSNSRVQFQQYRIDDTLGRLDGNVSLANKLYKVYLHALTSHCLADPLTGRTGTEEALHDLHSAGCWSFQSLNRVEENLLEKIGSLTPIRQFYPKHLRVMQQTIWSKLSPLSQHHEFYVATRSILEYAERLCVFQERDELPSKTTSMSIHLLERAASRNSVYYPAEFSYSPPRSDVKDTEYQSRDGLDKVGTAQETAVCDIARRVFEWPERLGTCYELFEKLRGWKNICGSANGSGLSLQYDSRWLKPDLAKEWISLYNLLRSSRKPCDQYSIMFVLSAITYGSPESSHLVGTLLAFATCSDFQVLNPPSYPHYTLTDGCEPDREKVLQMIKLATHSFECSPEAKLSRLAEESEVKVARRRYATYEKQCKIKQADLTRILVEQWPCEKPQIPAATEGTRFDIRELGDKVEASFGSWYRNMLLGDHIREVEKTLRELHLSLVRNSNRYQFARGSIDLRATVVAIPISSLFTRKVPALDRSPPSIAVLNSTEQHYVSCSERTHSLISEFRGRELPFHKIYGDNMAISQRTLEQETVDAYPEAIPFPSEYLANHYTQCKAHLDRVFGAIVNLSDVNLTAEWKRALISLANAVISVQRAQRLLGFTLGNQRDEFFKELKNTSCDGWDPSLYPDWLLVQIDGHFIVRSIQADVALEMISPTSGGNTALQLNMGEGKSSIIVPVIAATLADRTRLTLVDRLGGLTNRRIFYMPFSRAINPDVDQVRVIQDLYEECMRVGGILVTQPDHILSFKLMAIDRQLSANDPAHRPITDQLLKSQRWLENNTRDILDESDEILHVRFQLVYTVRLQRHLEDHPDRWTTIQQVFMHRATRRSKWCLPPIRILMSDAGAYLVSLIAQNIVNGALPNYTLGQLDRQMRASVLSFITELQVADAIAQQVQNYCENSALWKGLLLLRGLLAHGILVYVLKERRWRVDYGLDQQRSMLAVPYRAKDVPALRAEFGHPDVAVALTCLSYYYGGLSEHQIGLCFARLYKLDNPTLEYETWIHDCDNVPQSLRELNGVNLRSPEQCQQYLIPLFRRNISVIDFFLSQVVFPKEAKEFPQKQAASGWDIAEKKHHVTTGFSGTNDNRYLLPDDAHGERLSAQKFLELLVQQEPEIRVLLDVGAEMLELQNDALVAQWLALNQNAQAAVYFGDNDQLMVLTRDGAVESFVSSPFNQQLDQCLLYLDDAHTRGTDVKLPRDVRAAVTLGPKVTKDRLVQGCMRMRKLGSGHSVMFFAPLEIDRSIREAAKKMESDTVEVIDILRWVMLETCSDIQQRAHQWAEQGFDHGNRASAWSKFCDHQQKSKPSDLLWIALFCLSV